MCHCGLTAASHAASLVHPVSVAEALLTTHNKHTATFPNVSLRYLILCSIYKEISLVQPPYSTALLSTLQHNINAFNAIASAVECIQLI